MWILRNDCASSIIWTLLSKKFLHISSITSWPMFTAHRLGALTLMTTKEENPLYLDENMIVKELETDRLLPDFTPQRSDTFSFFFILAVLRCLSFCGKVVEGKSAVAVRCVVQSWLTSLIHAHHTLSSCFLCFDEVLLIYAVSVLCWLKLLSLSLSLFFLFPFSMHFHPELWLCAVFSSCYIEVNLTCTLAVCDVF